MSCVLLLTSADSSCVLIIGGDYVVYLRHDRLLSGHVSPNYQVPGI